MSGKSPMPLICVTPGEPAGIGPELMIRAAAEVRDIRLLAIADRDLLADTALRLGLGVAVRDHGQQADADSGSISLEVLHCPLVAPAKPGKLNTANSHYVLETIKRATELCLGGEASALVTGPVHKGIINDAGIKFTGHTEMLGRLAKQSRVVMMLASPQLKVALVTTHLPLRAVADAITVTAVRESIEILDQDLKQYFGLAEPRILVCGLNPHAGEDGHLGHEDQAIIEPAIAAARAAGIDARGPLPADTIFTAGPLEQCDAVLAMYHDQGLPVVKHSGFGATVNVTLGLPFVRTSVDHGTALDLAGSGSASPASLIQAIQMAREMSSR